MTFDELPVGSYFIGALYRDRDFAVCFKHEGRRVMGMQVGRGKMPLQTFSPIAPIDKQPTADQIEELRALIKPTSFVSSYNSSIMLGADPEMFVVDKNGVVVPAWSFLAAEGTNHPPELPYWDGFQAEFKTYNYTCLERQVSTLQRGLYNLANAAAPYGTLTTANTVEIPEELLMTAAEQHVRLGCMPSRNAYGDQGEEVVNGRMLNVRFAGAHIHFGTDQLPIETMVKLVKALDASMGVASVALFGDEEAAIRRKFYGRAGEFRLPKHGLEYRVLSSAALATPQRWHFIVDIGRYLMRLTLAGIVPEGFKVDEQAVRAAINNGDQQAARNCLAQNEDFWCRFFGMAYGALDLNDNPSTKPLVTPWRWLMGERKMPADTLHKSWNLQQPPEYFSGALSCVRNLIA